MDFSLFVTGVGIGFIMAAPFGPIGVLCMRRTLASGPASGLVSGLGAATADALCSSLAGLGLTFVSTLILSHQLLIRLLGGLFLSGLGIKTFFAAPSASVTTIKKTGLFSIYTSTFFLTMVNPITTLSFAAVFAGLGLPQSYANHAEAMILITGVFLGSASWWLALSSGIKFFHLQIDVSVQKWINKLSGFILTVFGIMTLLSIINKL